MQKLQVFFFYVYIDKAILTTDCTWNTTLLKALFLKNSYGH